MKLLIVLALASLAHARTIDPEQPLTAFGFNAKYAIPLGEKIRAYEEANLQSRIIGGSHSNAGEIPYQAGVLTNFIGVSGTGVCGGSLVTPNRVIHAAHCWFDGLFQGSQTTIVLGSTSLFFGGTRLVTSNIIVHPDWNPNLIRSDVAVIFLPSSVTFNNLISPVALPSANEALELYVGETAIASGFGLTSNGGSIPTNQVLSHVQLQVITNSQCFTFFPWNVVDSNICTAGNGVSTCSGDSGGPLVVTRNNQPLLIGITSFGSSQGCGIGFPAAFARVTSFLSFFNQYL